MFISGRHCVGWSSEQVHFLSENNSRMVGDLAYLSQLNVLTWLLLASRIQLNPLRLLVVTARLLQARPVLRIYYWLTIQVQHPQCFLGAFSDVMPTIDKQSKQNYSNSLLFVINEGSMVSSAIRLFALQSQFCPIIILRAIEVLSSALVDFAHIEEG